jgi:hypothetical protein
MSRGGGRGVDDGMNLKAVVIRIGAMAGGEQVHIRYLPVPLLLLVEHGLWHKVQR